MSSINKDAGKFKPINIIGEVYGRLTVKEELPRIGYVRRFRCLCKCENEIIVRLTNLRNGRTTSCGCFHKEQLSRKNSANLVGQRFGKLVAIKRDGSLKRKSMWLCMCECGGYSKVRTDDLRSGGVMSCGCREEIDWEWVEKNIFEDK